MPAFSGLYDGVHGEAYSAIPKSDARPPQARGIIRTFMQRQSMHGHVEALGRNAPAAIAQVDADRGDITVPGTFDYDTRTVARDHTITNIEPAYSNESRARPANPSGAALAHTYDTSLVNGHPKDLADSGVTSPAQTESISDGT